MATPIAFALSPHSAIKMTKKVGNNAHILLAISAEDCLYVDLSVVPRKVGS
jgi:hypothetical protein